MTVRFQGAVSCPRTILLNHPLKILFSPPPSNHHYKKCKQNAGKWSTHWNSIIILSSMKHLTIICDMQKESSLCAFKPLNTSLITLEWSYNPAFLSEVFRKWSRSRQACSWLRATSYHYFRAFSHMGTMPQESPIQLDHVWYKHGHRLCYTYMYIYECE